MKRLISVVLVILLGFNIYLGYEVYQLKQNRPSNTSETKEVSKIVSEFETDVTKVVADVEDKVVSVIKYQNKNMTGNGSGVIYEIDGNDTYAITNHHVIDGADEVGVKLSTGEEVEARIIGSDAYTDLALLKIEGHKEVKPIAIGDSSKVKVGEFVVAMGSPLGVEFSNSSTFGIISGKDRLVPVDLNGDGRSDWDMVVMQTDAAINPGNSGGALVNMNGELVGINSLKISSSNVEGMGFSIPINEVIPIIKQLKDHGKVEYPIVGISAVSVDELHPFYQRQLGLEEVQGVLVIDVLSDSAADKAGIKENDILVNFDGQEVSNFKDFRKALYSKRKGDKVKISLIRDKKEIEVEVTLN